MPEVTGELVRVSDCSATVKIDGGKKDVQIEDDEGVVRRFTANKSRTTTWAPATLVEPIYIPEVSTLVASEPKEKAMSKSTATTTTVPGGKGKTRTKATKAPGKPAGDPKPPKAPKAAKPAKEPKEAKQKAAKPAQEPKAKKVSALDAAAQVLAAKPGHAMKCPELVAEMEKQGLWTSPGGKTPAATLYSAIITEIKKKGEKARFKKVDAGSFVAA